MDDDQRSCRGGVASHAIAGFALLLGCVLLSLVGTLLMLPLWRWLEHTYGLEAVGHSGPAEWCYLATFLACLLTATLLYVTRLARAK